MKKSMIALLALFSFTVFGGEEILLEIREPARTHHPEMVTTISRFGDSYLIRKDMKGRKPVEKGITSADANYYQGQLYSFLIKDEASRKPSSVCKEKLLFVEVPLLKGKMHVCPAERARYFEIIAIRTRMNN